MQKARETFLSFSQNLILGVTKKNLRTPLVCFKAMKIRFFALALILLMLLASVKDVAATDSKQNASTAIYCHEMAWMFCILIAFFVHVGDDVNIITLFQMIPNWVWLFLPALYVLLVFILVAIGTVYLFLKVPAEVEKSLSNVTLKKVKQEEGCEKILDDMESVCCCCTLCCCCRARRRYGAGYYYGG